MRNPFNSVGSQAGGGPDAPAPRRVPLKLAAAGIAVVLLLVVIVVSSLDSSPGDQPTPAANDGNQPWWAADNLPDAIPSSTVPPSDTFLIVGPETTSPSASPTPTSSPARTGKPPVKQPPRAPAGQRHEAEYATITRGAVESNHWGYSGAGFANYENTVGSAVRWTVQATAAGNATLTIRYANGTSASRPMDVAVNGTVVARGAAFGGTGGWSTWQSRTFTVPLVAGVNTVTATATTSAGGPNVDYAEVR